MTDIKSVDRLTTILAHESELEFELGGPAYRLMQRIGLIQGAGPSLVRRAIGFLLITWVPLLLFSLIEGRALGPTPRESLLLDFAAYARFFLAVPLLFLAEVVTGPRLRAAGLNFVQGNFVRPEDLPTVEAAIVRASRRREALLPELIMLGIALLGAWYLTLETVTGRTAATSWHFVFAVYLVLMELICLGSLLIFVPLLARTRRAGLRQYSILADTYNRAFEQKWVAGQAPPDEPLLGSADIQSLADLGNSFGVIREMRIFPFSQQQILQIAVIASLPGLPLIFLVMPVGEMLKLLAGALL
jgi:hypothetical protein